MQPTPGNNEISIVAVLALLQRQRRLIAQVTIGAIVLTAAFILLRPRTWTSSVSFIASSHSQQSQAAGLAAQFGFNLPTQEPTQSPAFFVDLVRARGILRAVADSSLLIGGQRHSVPDVLDIHADNAALRRERTVDALSDLVEPSLSQRTGVITVNVKARTPGVALALCKLLLSQVEQFNMQTRQSAAGFERRFYEQRLAEIGSELHSAEDAVEDFRRANVVASSPALTLERSRLDRRVEFSLDLQRSVAQALERAKLDEARDTPLVTVVDAPVEPARPDSRHLVTALILAAISGAAFGILAAFLRDLINSSRLSEQSPTPV